LRKLIQPYLANAFLSDRALNAHRVWREASRKRVKTGHLADVYLRLDDPYSYLLIQCLELLQKRYPLQYRFRTVLEMPEDAFPAPRRWAENAFEDAQHLAELYTDLGLQFPARTPSKNSQYTLPELTAQLLHWELNANYLNLASQLFHAYWHRDEQALNNLVEPRVKSSLECYQHHLQANQQRLNQQGHYQSAMVHYQGEWYWGLRRLVHLEERLNNMGLGTSEVFARSHQSLSVHHDLNESECARIKNKELAMYLSIRSPYSYLGLAKAKKLADQYQLRLVLKPVLPMLMRGMKVPRSKSRYSLLDVKREAKRLNLPFGFIADPLGRGVENTYALFEFAQQQGKEITLFESIARGAWSENLDAASEQGMKIMIERAGLNWTEAHQLTFGQLNNDWHDWAQENLLELYELNHWGVPCFKFEDLAVFGQDCFDRIEHAVIKAANKT